MNPRPNAIGFTPNQQRKIVELKTNLQEDTLTRRRREQYTSQLKALQIDPARDYNDELLEANRDDLAEDPEDEDSEGDYYGNGDADYYGFGEDEDSEGDYYGNGDADYDGFGNGDGNGDGEDGAGQEDPYENGAGDGEGAGQEDPDESGPDDGGSLFMIYGPQSHLVLGHKNDTEMIPQIKNAIDTDKCDGFDLFSADDFFDENGLKENFFIVGYSYGGTYAIFAICRTVNYSIVVNGFCKINKKMNENPDALIFMLNAIKKIMTHHNFEDILTKKTSNNERILTDFGFKNMKTQPLFGKQVDIKFENVKYDSNLDTPNYPEPTQAEEEEPTQAEEEESTQYHKGSFVDSRGRRMWGPNYEVFNPENDEYEYKERPYVRNEETGQWETTKHVWNQEVGEWELPSPKSPQNVPQADEPADEPADRQFNDPKPPSPELDAHPQPPASPRAKTPRAKTPSPRAKTPSPRAKTPSPRAKTPSPRAKTPSPRAKTPSPRAKTPSPRAKTPSPRAKTPRAKTPSPRAIIPPPPMNDDMMYEYPYDLQPQPERQPSPRAKTPRAKTPSPRAIIPPPPMNDGMMYEYPYDLQPQPERQPSPRAKTPQPERQPSPRAKTPSPRTRKEGSPRTVGRTRFKDNYKKFFQDAAEAADLPRHRNMPTQRKGQNWAKQSQLAQIARNSAASAAKATKRNR